AGAPGSARAARRPRAPSIPRCRGAAVDHHHALFALARSSVAEVEALWLVEVELDGRDGLLVPPTVAYLQVELWCVTLVPQRQAHVVDPQAEDLLGAQGGPQRSGDLLEDLVRSAEDVGVVEADLPHALQPGEHPRSL